MNLKYLSERIMQLGNDIVDLKVDAAIRKGFVSRILHPEERQRYPDGIDDPIQIWTLWAAKEAAFKAFRQTDAGFFLPHHWNVDLEQARVYHKTRSWSLDIELSGDYVAATCRSHSFAVLTQVFAAEQELSPREQSYHGRRLLDALLQDHAPGACLVKDEGDIPRLTYQGHAIPFSLSHHGRHVLVSLGLTSPGLNPHPAHP